MRVMGPVDLQASAAKSQTDFTQNLLRVKTLELLFRNVSCCFHPNVELLCRFPSYEEFSQSNMLLPTLKCQKMLKNVQHLKPQNKVT